MKNMVLSLIVYVSIICNLFSIEVVWSTNFPSQEGYGFTGDVFLNPDNDWSIDNRNVSLENDTSPDYFRVIDGVLEARDLECSYQLNDINQGFIWQSETITLDAEDSYYLDIELESSSECDDYSSPCSSEDFVKCYYLDNLDNVILVDEFQGAFGRNKLSGRINNTSECKICLEIDCSAENEYYRIKKVSLYQGEKSTNNNGLIISKMCIPNNNNDAEKYIQISNIGDKIIDLSTITMEAIYYNRTFYSWELKGLIVPGESIVIGDFDNDIEANKISTYDWHRKSWLWDGLNKDGAQLVDNDKRGIIDRVVGVNFNDGYIVRQSGNQSTQETSSSDDWIYYQVNQLNESAPGEFELNETLPVLNFSYNIVSNNNNAQYIEWSLSNSYNIIGFNIYYSRNNDLSNSIRINHELIEDNLATSSYSLHELQDNGYLWIEALYTNTESCFSDPISYIHYSGEDNFQSIEVPDSSILDIFPNPISLDSEVKINNGQNSLEIISIYNIKGQKVNEIKYSGKIKEANLSKLLYNIPSGTYLLKIKVGNNHYYKKVVMIN